MLLLTVAAGVVDIIYNSAQVVICILITITTNGITYMYVHDVWKYVQVWERKQFFMPSQPWWL